MLKIACWNVNSVKSRLLQLIQLIEEESPDVILLQEIKCVSEAFPSLELESYGYNIAAHGQKSYNGVAILSKYRIEEVIKGIPGYDDEASRYIEAVISVNGAVVRIASVYVPNGQPAGSEKFDYKLAFFDALHAHMQYIYSLQEAYVIGGDFNVCAANIDVYNVEDLEGSVCFLPIEKKKMQLLSDIGFYDAFRSKYPDAQEFTWWDYRRSGWQKNEGLRIDYYFLSPEALDITADIRHLKDYRALPQASDHIPVILELNV